VIFPISCNIFEWMIVKFIARQLGAMELMEQLLMLPASKLSNFRGLYISLLLTSLLFSPAVHAQSGPFTGLAGSWVGNGSISLGNGTKERIRCRATYSVGADGNGLRQNLRCASDSYRFDLSSNVNYLAGQVSGMWSETSRNIGGTLIGSARAGLFQVIVTSPSFSANLSLTTQGDRQSVVVTAPPGGQLSGVSITLARAK